jgi:hypothetical protein
MKTKGNLLTAVIVLFPAALTIMKRAGFALISAFHPAHGAA